MLTVLSITSKNIKLLKSYQVLYLVIAIIFWILICLFYAVKIILLFYAIYKKKLQSYLAIKMKKILLWMWIITNCGAYILMLIGFIYDIIVLLSKGKIGSAVYMIIYFGICFLFVIFSIIDFCNLDNIASIICEHPKKYKRKTSSSTGYLKNESDKILKEKNN